MIWKERGMVLGRNGEPKALSRATQSKVSLEGMSALFYCYCGHCGIRELMKL